MSYKQFVEKLNQLFGELKDSGMVGNVWFEEDSLLGRASDGRVVCFGAVWNERDYRHILKYFEICFSSSQW